MALVQLAAASGAYREWRRGSEAGAPAAAGRSPARAQRPRAAAAATDYAAARAELAAAAERLFQEAVRGEALRRLGGGAPEEDGGDAQAAAAVRAGARRAGRGRARDALERGTARLEAGEARLRRARAALDRRAAELGAKLGACEALVAPRAETKPRVGSSRGTWRGPSTDAARTSTSTQVVPERAAAPAPAAAAAAGARVVGVAARPGGAVEARVELAGGAALALELAPDAADARGRLRLRAAHLAHAHVDVADVVAVARREPPPEDVRLVVREARARVRRFDARAAEVRRLRGLVAGVAPADAAVTSVAADVGDWSAVLAFPAAYPDHGARRFALASLRAATDAAAVGGDAPRRARAVAAALARGDAVEDVLARLAGAAGPTAPGA